MGEMVLAHISTRAVIMVIACVGNQSSFSRSCSLLVRVYRTSSVSFFVLTEARLTILIVVARCYLHCLADVIAAHFRDID